LEGGEELLHVDVMLVVRMEEEEELVIGVEKI